MLRQQAFYVAMQWYRPEAERYPFLKIKKKLRNILFKCTPLAWN
jgi:hypothetical protein